VVRISLWAGTVALACIIAGCSVSSTTKDSTPTTSDQPVGHEAAPAQAVTEPTDISGLSAAFLAYAYPLDGGDLELGWRTFEEPLIRANMLDLGACLDAEGFRAVAQAFRESESTPPREAWQFPDLARLRETGFNTPAPGAAWNLMGSLEPDGISDSQHPLLEDLARYPDLEIEATLQAANDLNAVLWSCVVGNPMADSFDHLHRLKADWRAELHRLDEEPVVAETIPVFLDCVRAIDPLFADIEGVDQWWAAQTGQRINIEFDPDITQAEREATLLEWGQGYSECVAPVAAARAAGRLAARQAHVDEDLAQLLEVQSRLNADL